MSGADSKFSDDPLARNLIRGGLLGEPLALFVLAGLARFAPALPATWICALLAAAVFWTGTLLLYRRYRQQAVVQTRDGLRQQSRWLRARAAREAGELRAARQRRDRLARDERAEMAAALRDMQTAHLENGLAAALLADATIPALGPGLKERLLAQGLASAADVDAMRLLSIRGLGDAQSQALLAWRNSVAARLNLTMPMVLPARRVSSLQKTFERQHTANDAAQAEAVARSEACQSELAVLQPRLDESARMTFTDFLREEAGAWHVLTWPAVLALVASQVLLPIGLLAGPAWVVLADRGAPRPAVVRLSRSPNAPAQERPASHAAPAQPSQTRPTGAPTRAAPTVRSPTRTARPAHTRKSSSTPRGPTRSPSPSRSPRTPTLPALSSTPRAARSPTETHTPRPSKTLRSTKTPGPTRSPSPTKTLKPTHTPTGTASPTATIPADEFQDLVSLTSPIARGETASITIRTNPGAACSIKVMLKSGASHSKSLAPTTAGDDGLCSWTWKVSTRTAAGTWSISVKTADIEVKYAFVIE